MCHYRIPTIYRLNLGRRVHGTTRIINGQHPRLRTAGDELVVIRGKSFGPKTTLYASAHYRGNDNFQYQASQCNVTVDDSQVECLSAPGVGVNHKWVVVIAEQESKVAINGTSSYYAPHITISVTNPRAMPLQGGGLVTLTGKACDGVRACLSTECNFSDAQGRRKSQR